jgi:endonuclease/exonuclease/phosphatase (EEP) superfamily protein YafD
METFLFIAKIVLYLLGLLAIILTVLPFLKFSAWWVRIGDFPRLQIAALCIMVGILFAALGFILNKTDYAFIALLAACALYQFYCVLPYLPFYPKQVEQTRQSSPEKTLKLLISNVFMENENTEKFIDLVRKVNPDIFLLAEVNQRWVDAVSVLDEDYPHSIKHPLENTYGLALFSKLELKNAEVKFLVEDDIPSFHTNVKLRSGKLIKLYCLHPRPPAPTENDRSLERDAELLVVGRIADKTDEPTIVAGDLNDVAWSRTTTLFQKISGLLDPRIGRGLYNSFHAEHPLLRFPLDHVFHSNDFRLVELKRMPNIGSDHFPIYIALSFEPAAELTQEEPKADAEEKKEAVETIVEAFETFEGEKEKRINKELKQLPQTPN